MKILKTIIILLYVLILSTISLSQNVYIPDASFKTALLANQNINLNNDNEIQVNEAVSYTGQISIGFKGIYNLTGIEAFINITALYCNVNHLTNLDVSSNTKLINLWCQDNNLNSLVLTNCSQLILIQCQNNQLANLDISNLTQLQTLNCQNNHLTSLDISNNTLLQWLNCGINQISLLDVSNNIQFTTLYCSDNLLTNLSVSNNSQLIELACDQNYLASLVVSNNLQLKYLGCEYNQLTNLDVTLNTQLETLHCDSNQLTNLNITNNTHLKYLRCERNLLSSLNVSNNMLFTTLKCSHNLLTSLDVSHNSLLTELSCISNHLTSLDISNNPNITNLSCNSNLLTSLNLRNGNNANLTFLYAYNNLYLNCIEVDNVQLALTYTYWYIDDIAVYRTNCNLSNHIMGSLLIDSDCLINGDEIGYKGVIVKTEPNFYYGISNINGVFDILTDSGNYIVKPLINHPLIIPFCPEPFSISVNFDSINQDTSGLIFFTKKIPCPLLTIDITSNRRRRCSNNNTYIKYSNDGFADADNVQIHVKFPEYVGLKSADHIYTVDSNGIYLFNIGSLLMQSNGIIHIIDSVACINGITGLTQCTEAWITPNNNCINNLDSTILQWDHSSINIPAGECMGDSVRFTIINTGNDMLTSSEYRIYADDLLVFSSQFQIQAGESIFIEVFATGQTIRLEADQHPEHPGNSHPNAIVEACGNNGVPLNYGMVNQFPMDDEDVNKEVECLPIIDSYDPNDKQVSPSGIGQDKIVHPETMLEYVIRFQNTGMDTAYSIVIVDTLSEHFDLSTIQWGIASAAYSLNVHGQGKPVLTFTFENINLPSVTTNEQASQGFVKFKIKPLSSLTNGTIISNSAYIYFDFNTPITTNNSWVMISDSIPTGGVITIINTKPNPLILLPELYVVPNPTKGNFTIHIEKYNENMNYKIKVIDILGNHINIPYQLNNNNIRFNANDLKTGIYIIEIKSDNAIIGRTKVIIK